MNNYNGFEPTNLTEGSMTKSDLERTAEFLKSLGMTQCECKRSLGYDHYPDATGDFLIEKIVIDDPCASEEIFEDEFRLVIYPKYDEDYNYLHIIFDKTGRFRHFDHSGE